MSMGTPSARRFIGAEADGYREVAPASFVAMGAGAAPGFTVPQPTNRAPAVAQPAEPPVTREELMKMIEEAQGKRPPDSREDAQDRRTDPSLLGSGYQDNMNFGPEERSAWWDTYDDAGMVGRGLIDADKAIQESQGLLALAPLGMIAPGAGVPLMAANAVQGYQSGGNIGMGLGGAIGSGLRSLFGGDRPDPNVVNANNITPAQAAAMAAQQRAAMAPKRGGDRNESPRERKQRKAESRSRDLADRASRGGGLPY